MWVVLVKERDISLGIGSVDREVGAIGRLINNWFIKYSVECRDGGEEGAGVKVVEMDFVKRKSCFHDGKCSDSNCRLCVKNDKEEELVLKCLSFFNN